MISPTLLVLTHLPNQLAAESLAKAVLEQRLAACVNIGGLVRSLYHWKGQLETAEEIPLAIKTNQAAYIRLEALIRTLHPYEVPEIIAVPIERGSADYLEWVAQEINNPFASSPPGK